MARASTIRDPVLRRFATAIFREYRKTGSAARNENYKHVMRMVRVIRGHVGALQAIDCDPQILEVSLLVSDLGKEPHFIKSSLDRYGGDRFKAFLDHCRISMRVANRIRNDLGVSDSFWRQILRSVIGHDGPSIDGSWWKKNYEGELRRKYPKIHSIHGIVHCYLDRLDQGGIFRSANGQLNGGLRKISYDLAYRNPSPEKIPEIIRDLFGTTHSGTIEQVNYLDREVTPRWLGDHELPEFLEKLKHIFRKSHRYYERIRFSQDGKEVLVVMNDKTEKRAHNLDEFWRLLAQVTF